MERQCIVTGANGFVGSRLRFHLERAGWKVIGWTRHPKPGGVAFRLGENVSSRQLEGVEAVVHCAYDFKARGWHEIQAVNVNGSRRFLQAARDAGVKKLVFISSISAFPGCRSLYGKAKMEIEA